MKDSLVQTTPQPFIKLAQSNMDLLTKFTQSPEVASQSVESVSSLLRQAQESATNLIQSQAFSQMMQGLLKNYTEFMTEMTQSWMSTLAQNQEAMVNHTQELSENVIEASDVRGRRPRQAA